MGIVGFQGLWMSCLIVASRALRGLAFCGVLFTGYPANASITHTGTDEAGEFKSTLKLSTDNKILDPRVLLRFSSDGGKGRLMAKTPLKQEVIDLVSPLTIPENNLDRAVFATEILLDPKAGQDHPKALVLLRELYHITSSPVMAYFLGVAIERGNGIAANYSLACEWYKRAADGGVEPAFLEHGICLIGSHPAKAEYWLNRAVKTDVAGAKLALGTLTLAGAAKNEDAAAKRRGLDQIIESANEDSLPAQQLLVTIYRNGFLGVSKDAEKAFYWTLQAARNGDPEAQFATGYNYANGVGTEADGEQSIVWYKRLIEEHDREELEWRYFAAISNLGFVYAEGIPPVKTDKKLALYWFEKALASDDPRVYHNVGHAYFYGEGAEPDIDKAAEYLKKSADAGLEKSKYLLGLIHLDEKGPIFDLNAAIRYIRPFADKGEAHAQYHLGRIYANETSPFFDLVKAAAWFGQASEGGNLDARYYLAAMRLYGHGSIKRDGDMAYATFRRTGELGHAKSFTAATVLMRNIEERANLMAFSDISPELRPVPKFSEFVRREPAAISLDEAYTWLHAVYRLHRLSQAGNPPCKDGGFSDLNRSRCIKENAMHAGNLRLIIENSKNPQLLFASAMAFGLGLGVPFNPKTSFSLMKKAASKGHVIGKIFGAYMAGLGIGTRPTLYPLLELQDDMRVVRYLRCRRASGQGCRGDRLPVEKALEVPPEQIPKSGETLAVNPDMLKSNPVPRDPATVSRYPYYSAALLFLILWVFFLIIRTLPPTRLSEIKKSIAPGPIWAAVAVPAYWHLPLTAIHSPKISFQGGISGSKPKLMGG